MSLNNQCGYVVPFWTLVVTVSAGVPTSAYWDDDCSLCARDQCIDGNCGVDSNKICTSGEQGGGTDCDLKIYICWTGTDRNGAYMTSAGRRYSQFRRWSLNAAYNSAANFADQNLPRPPDELPLGGIGGADEAGPGG